MNLSPHFTLEELTFSETAARNGLDNTPSQDVVANLTRLADLLEKVRSLLGDRPLHINSGYRSIAVNRALGSKDTSKHVLGLAADLVCPGFGAPLAICEKIKASGLVYDQLIHEYGRWVHIGLAEEGAPLRQQDLTIDGTGTRAGLVAVA